jgi:hypothetical protein
MKEKPSAVTFKQIPASPAETERESLYYFKKEGQRKIYTSLQLRGIQLAIGLRPLGKNQEL